MSYVVLSFKSTHCREQQK